MPVVSRRVVVGVTVRLVDEGPDSEGGWPEGRRDMAGVHLHVSVCLSVSLHVPACALIRYMDGMHTGKPCCEMSGRRPCMACISLQTCIQG